MPSIVIIFKCRLQPFSRLVGDGLRMPHIKGHSINIYIHSGKSPAGTMTGTQPINFVWHELSLNAQDNYGAGAAVWTPEDPCSEHAGEEAKSGYEVPFHLKVASSLKSPLSQFGMFGPGVTAQCLACTWGYFFV
ncbi:hypothetical protein VNO77_34073 [Canavalia gladiata]|uniref:Uncharacterized protein n=1 Tax=Canavalia gladiata TaxID=3824 RepID=A0AAN9KFX8_CANGL